MSKEVSVTTTNGVSAFGLLGVVLVLAKVFGYTDLSWWWCTAPFWIPWAIVLAIICVPLLFAGVLLGGAWIFDEVGRWRRRRARRIAK